MDGGPFAFSALVAASAWAETIGYSSPNFDDNYQTIMREAAKEYAESLGHDILIEDAREDVGTQLSQIQNFTWYRRLLHRYRQGNHHRGSGRR